MIIKTFKLISPLQIVISTDKKFGETRKNDEFTLLDDLLPGLRFSSFDQLLITEELLNQTENVLSTLISHSI